MYQRMKEQGRPKDVYDTSLYEFGCILVLSSINEVQIYVSCNLTQNVRAILPKSILRVSNAIFQNTIDYTKHPNAIHAARNAIQGP